MTQGGTSRCTAIPATGYVVAGWGGACAATGPNLQCGLTNIQDNQDSTVSFSAIPVNTYHISATVVLGNGSVSCKPTTVAKGGQSTCIAVPDTGWQVQNWGGACAVSGSDVECFLPKIRRDEAATVSFALILPQTYTVTATVIGGNGSVTCNPSPVARKGQSTCTALPDPGYQVQGWGGDCTNVLPSLQCYFSKIERNLQSTVSYSAVPVNHYTVSAVVIGGHGTVSCAPTSVTAGQSSICNALPEAGYQLQHWDGACLLAGTNAQCALTNIQTDQSSTVSFALIPPITYTVTATVASGSGTVNCGPSPVVKGGSSTCTAVPAAGWQVSGWTGACTATGANAQCALSNIQSNQTSAVSFVALPPVTYAITASVVGGNGSVSCTPATVIQGGNSSCTAVPATGFQVQSWGGACAFAGSNAQCALTNIQADQVSTVSFALTPPATYTVTATAAYPYGTASCLPNNVKAGDNSTCYAVPQAGFRVKSWGGACAFAGSNAQCSLTNINSNQASTVSFELIPPATYTVSAIVTGGSYGSVSCLPGTVKAGESSTCYAVPYAGYRVQSWGGACAAAGSNAQCALTKIQANQTATVSFELIPPATFTVTATVVGGNGNVSCLPTSVIAGNSSTCFAVPYAGYQIQSWSGDCAAAGNNAQCSLPNIQTDQTATVSFEPVPLPT